MDELCGARVFAQVKDLIVFSFRRVNCGNVPVLQIMHAQHFIPVFTMNFLSIRHKLMGKFCFLGGEFAVSLGSLLLSVFVYFKWPIFP